MWLFKEINSIVWSKFSCPDDQVFDLTKQTQSIWKTVGTKKIPMSKFDTDDVQIS